MLESSDPRPILLVDVDGVLNPWLARDCPPGFNVYSFFPGERVLLSPGHGKLLTSLADAYELVWATAWEHRANQLICPVLELPPLPVIEAVGNRACAWIDDEHQPDHYSWAERRGVPTLILDIDPAEGLTSDVVARLADWAADLADDRQP